LKFIILIFFFFFLKKSTIYLKCPPSRNIRFNVTESYKSLTCENTKYPGSFKYYKKYWKNWKKNEIGKKDKVNFQNRIYIYIFHPFYHFHIFFYNCCYK